ncbi:MAG: hypothetical protein ACRDKI_12075 [Solirubrobacterales bacterium]
MRWFSELLLRRQLRKAARCRLGEAPENTLVRVSGRVHGFESNLLEAPLSGRLCVYYSVSIQEMRGSDLINAGAAAYLFGTKTRGPVMASQQDAISFVLEDAGERAVIDPAEARISVGFDHVTRSKAAFDASPRQLALLRSHDLIRRNWFNTVEVEYREGVLELGQAIVVHGGGRREPDPERPQSSAGRDCAATRLRFTSAPRAPLVISHDPKSE